MDIRRIAGFTIIETMLVLAITGALVAAMFVGIGTSISIQRYRDAVTTFKDTLQEQYSALANVSNDRSNTWSCNSAAQTVEESGEARGQSDCVLLGRLVTVDAGEIGIYTVLGSQRASSTSGNDIAKLRSNYRLNVSSVVSESNALEWGTEIAWPRTGSGARTPTTPRAISFLFIRSPDSGQLYTFTSDVAPANPTPANLQSMLVEGASIPGQHERTICIEPTDLIPGERMAIVMSQFAVGPGAIEVMTNQLLQSSGRTARC